MAGCAVVTLLAVALLWPGGSNDESSDPLLLDAEPISAQVVAIELRACSYSLLDQCRLVQFEMSNGPYADRVGSIEESTDGFLAEGDDILVVTFTTESGQPSFSFYDYQRGNAMVWLLALFVAAVLLLGRWRGLGAIGGLLFSLLVIVVFTLPAILDGSNSLTVALVTASVIAFAALFLAHGIGLATAVALVSTIASLVITAVLAWVFVGATHLTGLADDTSVMLGGLANGIDARGILLAGIVIGALGVLDDVTVTQVSAVWELKRIQPELTIHQLVAPALRIGRDHISSTVNTLFLAYAGAALPLLLFFTEAGQGFRGVITRELVAAEVIRALVGSIGLVASVPIATWLAALVVSQDPTSVPDPGEIA
ncbi:MAG: YibE/F family protein, partial [Ilumatobacter sp.]